MVELIVALLAGLIVGMGIIGLSRGATTTFNEEMRTSVAEASLRAAITRLRADLQRAGYMSTGNILLDPKMAAVPGALPGSGNAAGYQPTAATPTNKGMSGIQGLAAIFWLDNGSNSTAGGGYNNALTLSASPPQPTAITPDLIQIAGNMTSSELFSVAQTPSSNNPCSTGGTVIYLTSDSPAMIRTLGGVVPTSSNVATLTPVLQSAFSPDPPSAFLVRFVDSTGRAQYLATCAGASAGFDSTQNPPQPFVRIDGGNTPLLFSSGGVGGAGGFSVTGVINPVQIVQWEITSPSATVDTEPATATGNLDFLSLTKVVDTAKYDLMRTYVDATGTPVAATKEIVAEYAVDLSFAFSGDTGTSLAPALTALTTSCAFDDAVCNGRWAPQVSAAAAPYGPQRIRSVRARITTRAAQADRTANVPLANQYTAQTFMYRYNLGADPATSLTWARTRTITTEVALENQARNFY
jgi:hypothetical protein